MHGCGDSRPFDGLRAGSRLSGGGKLVGLWWARAACYLCFSALFDELSFELLSLEDDSFEEPSLEELSLEEPSFEEPSELDLSSFLESLPESLLEPPSEEDPEEDFFG